MTGDSSSYVVVSAFSRLALAQLAMQASPISLLSPPDDVFLWSTWPPPGVDLLSVFGPSNAHSALTLERHRLI